MRAERLKSLRWIPALAAAVVLLLRACPIWLERSVSPESILEKESHLFSVELEKPPLAPLFRVASDNLEHPRASGLVFSINGKRAGSPHSPHAEIAEKGGGRYSHWNGHLYFSTLDGSDPRYDGRIYSVSYAIAPANWAIALAVLVVGASIGFSRALRALWTKGPLFAIAIVTAWIAFPPREAMEIRPGELSRAEGNAVRWQLPATDFPLGVVRADSHGSPRASQLELYEDGVALPGPHAYHSHIASFGKGRYSHWNGDLIFSSSDGTDPIANGRKYVVRAPIEPAGRLLLIYLVALAIVALRASHRHLRFAILGVVAASLGIVAFGAFSRFHPIQVSVEIPLSAIRERVGAQAVYSFDVPYLVMPFLETTVFETGHALLASISAAGWKLGATSGVAYFEHLEVASEPLFRFEQSEGRFVIPGEELRGSITANFPVRLTLGGIFLSFLAAVLGALSLLRLERYGNRPWPFVRIASELMALAGAVLTVLNLIGLPLRMGTEDLSSLPRQSPLGPNDRSLDWNAAASRLAAIFRGADRTELVRSVSELVAERMTHNWWYESLDALDLQVPPWENWLLWLRGELSDDYRRYEFADPELALERGTGQCGQTSMALVGLLRRAGIASRIISLHGHTMGWAEPEEGKELILDPDYGLVFDGPYNALVSDPDAVRARYRTALSKMGTSEPDHKQREIVRAVLSSKPSYVEPEGYFGAEKMEFENRAYLLKWWIPFLAMVPLLLILISSAFFLSKFGHSGLVSLT